MAEVPLAAAPEADAGLGQEGGELPLVQVVEPGVLALPEHEPDVLKAQLLDGHLRKEATGEG